jgi:RimJ/RimL family protein N-acetyltransferase
VLDVAFGSLGVRTVRLECAELNDRSIRVAERCGFRRAGYRSATHLELPRADGEPSGDLLYELTVSEWRRGLPT